MYGDRARRDGRGTRAWVVTAPARLGLIAVAVAKALGASPVILDGKRATANSYATSWAPDRSSTSEENAVEVVTHLTGGSARTM